VASQKDRGGAAAARAKTKPVVTAASGIEPGQRRLNGIQTAGRELRNVTAPMFGIATFEDVAVRLRDGVELQADVYRPDAEGRFPALLSFSPYPRQIQNTRAPLGLVEAGASDFFVPRGYVHVIANARGTGGSGGVWTLLDHQEREDLFDLVEWAAAQPWCDGQVGMLGISYFAMAQLAAAVARPPSLKAIFPLGTNESVFDVAWHHGLFSQSFISAWIPAVGVLAQKKDDLWRGKRLELATKLLSSPLVHQRIQHVNGEALVAVLKKMIRSTYPEEPYGRIWREAAVEHPTHDAFWDDRDCLAALADVDIPVYLGCDWDNVIMHLPGTFTTWKGLAGNPNVRMSLLPEGGLNWPWESMHYEALGWFDHWLKGVDTGVMEGPPIRYYLPVADEWRTAQAWPPPESTLVAYALRADGVLAREEGEAGARSYQVTTPDTRQPNNADPPPLPEVLHWETEALSEPLDVAGNIELRLDASITALDTAWIAIVYDIDPQGEKTPVSGGWLRATLREVDEAKSVPGTPVVPCRVPRAVPVGEAVTYRIPIVPNARRFQPGHRIALTLASSDDGKDAPTILGFTHTSVGGASVNTIRSTSRLLLPILGPRVTH
jgi:putative CocE/NonD family hydrolase